MTPILAGTREGVARVTVSDGHGHVERALHGCDVHCLAVDPRDPSLAYAGTWDDGLRRSGDGGRTWEPVGGREIGERRIISLAVSSGGVAFAGTEPANLYRSDDGGDSWRRLPGLHDVPSSGTWFYPPRHGGQRVRSIVPHPHDPETVFAAIEVGGVMRSRDGGLSWEDHKPGCYADSHALGMHPLAPERVYQGAAGGVALSLDGGDSWQHAGRGVRRRFVWALAIDPADPDLWYVSAAYDPRKAHGDGSADAAIYRRRGERRWEAPRSAAGLRSMPFALLTLHERPGALVAGFGDGRLALSEDAGDSWQDLAVQLPRIRALAAQPRAVSRPFDYTRA
jgi:hypothetical protein